MKRTGFVLLAMALVPCLFAVDGVVLINQSTVTAAGGFPYRITQAGSYKLSGNLTVPDANTTAILITVSSVTIDLNGFSIAGPVVCTGTPVNCNTSGTGFGIYAPVNVGAGTVPSHVSVRNGNISGMGASGIALQGRGNSVDGVDAQGNQGNGIDVFEGTVIHSGAHDNGSNGIIIGGGSAGGNYVRNNTIGIHAGGLVFDNFAENNSLTGIDMTSGGYKGNVIMGSPTLVSGGKNLGQNLCESTICPGASF